MIVSRVTGNCPECAAVQSFGNVMVLCDRVLQGCEACGYRTQTALPEIHKKIIYLDQNIFSLAYRENQDKVKQGLARIAELAHLQLVVAPYSSLHADETQFFREHEELIDFIKQTSRGHQFTAHYTVEQNQIVKAFLASQDGNPTAYVLEERDALRSNVHDWENYFRVDINRPFEDIEKNRAAKATTTETLINALDSWTQTPSTFEQDVAIELAAAGPLYCNAYAKTFARAATGDLKAGVELSGLIVAKLIRECDERLSLDERFGRAVSFFQTEHCRRVPSQQLFARLMAAFKDQLRRGAYGNREAAKKRLSGFFYDLQHAATYAPYCDAYVTDNAMAALMRHPKVGVEQDYNCPVFSLSNWDAFLAWLDAVKGGMDEEHAAAVKLAYPMN